MLCNDELFSHQRESIKKVALYCFEIVGRNLCQQASIMIEEKLKTAFGPYFNAPFEAWKVFADLCELVNYKNN